MENIFNGDYSHYPQIGTFYWHIAYNMGYHIFYADISPWRGSNWEVNAFKRRLIYPNEESCEAACKLYNGRLYDIEASQ